MFSQLFACLLLRACTPSHDSTVPCKRGVPECYVMGSHAAVQLTLRVALTLVHHRAREQHTCTLTRWQTGHVAAG